MWDKGHDVESDHQGRSGPAEETGPPQCGPGVCVCVWGGAGSFHLLSKEMFYPPEIMCWLTSFFFMTELQTSSSLSLSENISI